VGGEEGSEGVLERIRLEQIRIFLGTSDSLHFLKVVYRKTKNYPFHQTLKMREMKQ